MINIKPIVWYEQSAPVEGVCFYTHVKGICPLGDFSIEWKGWKDRDLDYRCVYFNGDYIESQPTAAGAKDSAEMYYRNLVLSCVEEDK